MANFTYEQFEKAAQASGLYGQFSQADLNLARQNPDAGMAILQGKTDWANATTDEARALANLRVEQLRSQYGGYTGGTDGSGFYLNPQKTQTSNAGTGFSGNYSSQNSPSSFTYQSAPTYTSRYDAGTEALMNQILNREKFSYDPEADPSYSAYLKQYAREGERAMQDTIGSAAAATGGIPSSYAVAGASQARDYYAAKAADKLPEMEQLSYQRYLNDYEMKLSDLNTLREAEQLEYNRYLNALDQYNADRSFHYGKYLDQINHEAALRAEALDRANLAGQYGDYSHLADLGITPDTYDRDFTRKYQEAILKAEYGDYSGLEALGIKVNTSGTQEISLADQLKLAETASKYGDYSYLEALGIKTEEGRNADTVEELVGLYGGKVIPSVFWDDCVAVYGEEWLNENGFTRGEEVNEQSNEEVVGDYTTVATMLEAMKAAGNSFDEISEAIDEAVAKKLLTQTAGLRLKNKYR